MKRNLFKKLAAAAGAAVMAFTLVMPMGAAQAAGETINTKTPVTLTIEKHEGPNTDLSSSVTGKQETVAGNTIKGVEFTAVKIADIVQESDTAGNNAVKYKLTADAVKVNSDWTADSLMTGKELNDWVRTKKASDFGSLDGVGVAAVTDENGQAIFTTDSNKTGDNVQQLAEGQGLYLVVETLAPANITKRSAPFIVSLPMTDKENENTWMYEVYAYPKNSTAVTDAGKEIADINNVQDGISTPNKTTAEAQIGDIITYQVPVTAIVPDAGLKKLGITDTMSKGLTFVQAEAEASSDDVSVYTGKSVDEENKVPSTNYSVKAVTDDDGITTLEVYFTDDYLRELNNTPGTREFLFVYDAQLNKDAVLGMSGNTNDVNMIYNYTNNPSDIKVPGNTTTVYTWGIDLTKTGDDGKKLVGVEFTLKKADTELSFLYDDTISAYRYVVDADAESASKTLTTKTDGKLIIRGLDSGTYTLTETKTNDGYTLLKNPITITITGDNTNGTATATVDGKDVSMVADNGSASALIPITVVNNTGFDLPQTGAAGTAIFAIAGIVIVAAAGALLIFRRKTGR